MSNFFMKYLFITRLFSGLIPSMEKEKWIPFGVPAFYKIIEKISEEKIQADVILFCKTKEESKNFKKITKINFSELDINFYVVPFYNVSFRVNYLNLIFNDIFHAIYLLYRLFGSNYKLVYTDRANLKFALLSSLLRFPTVLRFLGIGNLHTLFRINKYTFLFQYLSLKKKYNLVICSEDGSPSRYFFKKYFHIKTPYKILLNGVSKSLTANPSFSIREKYNIDSNSPLLLFVGRLTEDKGAEEFIDTIISLKKTSNQFHAFIICGGGRDDRLERKIKDNSLDNRVFFERFIPHSLIAEFYRQIDIYISLNKYGNLSNTVLEAMNEGKCVVMLGKDEKDHTDESTEKLIPKNVALFIDRNNIVDDLTEKLEDMISNPHKINTYSKRMKLFAIDFLWSWDERIDYEIGLLQKVARRERAFEHTLDN